MDVGKPLGPSWSKEEFGTYVNVTTYFEPLEHPILILEIRACNSVAYLSNVAFYGESLGGFSARLKESASYDDFLVDLQICVDAMDAQFDLEVPQIRSYDEQE